MTGLTTSIPTPPRRGRPRPNCSSTPVGFPLPLSQPLPAVCFTLVWSPRRGPSLRRSAYLCSTLRFDRPFAGLPIKHDRTSGRRRARHEPLARTDRHRQPVRRRRQRTDPARIVDARRVVREVDIEDQPAVLGAEIGALDRIEEIPARPIGLGPAGSVAKGQIEPTAIALQPEQVEPQGLAAERESGDAEPDEPVLADVAGWDSVDHLDAIHN